MQSRRALFLIFLFLMASAVFGAHPELNHVRAVVKHYDGEVEFTDRGTLRTIPLRGEMAFRLGENDEMTLIVEQTNPLLFQYEFKDGPSTPNASFAAASKFAAVLKKLADALPAVDETGPQRGPGAPVRTAADDALIKAGFTPEFANELAENVAKIAAATKSIDDLVKKSGRTWSDARAIKNEIAGWSAFLDRTEEQLEVVRAADDALFDLVHKELATPAPSSGTQKNKAEVDDDPLRPTGGAGNAASGGRVDPKGRVDVDGDTPGSNVGSGTDVLLLAFDHVIRNAGEIGDQLDELRKIQKLAADIGKPITKDGITASVEEDRSQILNVSVQEDAEAAAAKATPKAGEYKFLVRADTAVEYELIEPAMVYSLVEREEWTTQPTEGGQFEIVRKDNDDINGMTLAGMLSITPRSLSDWSFAPSFQLGISPVKDRVGLFGGFSFRVFDLFKFGAGVAYQQTEKLSSAQHAGQVLESADELKTEVEPDTGFYFSLTLDLGKKN